MLLRFQVFIKLRLEDLQQLLLAGDSQAHRFEQVVLIHQLEGHLALQLHYLLTFVLRDDD